VFSIVLFLAPSAHAEEKKTDKPNAKPPVMVTVQAGDSLTSIAEAHGTDFVHLFDANDFISNPDVINPGDNVRIPNADEQLPDRYGNFAATAAPVVAATQPVSTYRNPHVPQKGYYVDSAGNTYYNGYCTWYAKNRRPDLPNMLGNGGQWVANAAARGYATGSTPRAGAVAETSGHVAYVEAVNGDGTITISEMNGPGGFGVVDTRTVPASQYNYIY
jgi:surface antigen